MSNRNLEDLDFRGVIILDILVNAKIATRGEVRRWTWLRKLNFYLLLRSSFFDLALSEASWPCWLYHCIAPCKSACVGASTFTAWWRREKHCVWTKHLIGSPSLVSVFHTIFYTQSYGVWVLVGLWTGVVFIGSRLVIFPQTTKHYQCDGLISFRTLG